MGAQTSSDQGLQKIKGKETKCNHVNQTFFINCPDKSSVCVCLPLSVGHGLHEMRVKLAGVT